MDYREVLKTPLQQGRSKAAKERRQGLIRIRSTLIEEAIHWQNGTIVLKQLGNGSKVCFVKPGNKLEEKLGEFDMRPFVGEDKAPPAFNDLWVELAKIPLYIGHEDFKKILVLVYRNAYFLDHHPDEIGRLRYNPQNGVDRCIRELEDKLRDETMGAEIVPIYGLRGFLHFLDLLGWNEDVKYHHSKEGSAVFKEDNREKGREFAYEAGRFNTLLSCIKAPYLGYEVVNNVSQNATTPRAIDMKGVFDVMQSLVISNGVCPASRPELLKWFEGYIVESPA